MDQLKALHVFVFVFTGLVMLTISHMASVATLQRQIDALSAMLTTEMLTTERLNKVTSLALERANPAGVVAANEVQKREKVEGQMWYENTLPEGQPESFMRQPEAIAITPSYYVGTVCAVDHGGKPCDLKPQALRGFTVPTPADGGTLLWQYSNH